MAGTKSGHDGPFCLHIKPQLTETNHDKSSCAVLFRLRSHRDDGVVVGTGTRFGRMASQMANFLDQAGGLWTKGALHGKVGGAFTSTATQPGGQETTLFSVITNLLHFGMTIVGLNYGFAGQMKLDEVTG